MNLSIFVLLVGAHIAFLGAAEIKSPQQIQQELDKAENDFEIAQKIFIPWYTGPLIASSSRNCPPGKINLQPYLYLQGSYGVYGNDRSYSTVPNTFTVNPLLVFQTGLLSWLDIAASPQGTFKYREGKSGASFNDLGVSFGFQLYKESPYIPGIRFVYTQRFPTGAYSNLENGLDAIGSGVFQSVLGLNLGKAIWFFPLHPMALRLTTNVQLPTNKANVFGLNAYGGGGGAGSTNGTVNVGPTFNIDLGYELSITQQWVIALDVAYSLSGSNRFSGFAGHDENGVPYLVGGPVSDNLSLSPAIEYNVSDTGGLIVGAWFTVTGRNTSGFIAAVLSYSQSF
ncbi:MAG: hypothetical protein ACOYK9_03085 [Chlamydiia bacterium]